MSNIRPMTISDIARVAEIDVFAWRSSYRGIFSDNFLFNEMLVAKRIEFFANRLDSSAAEGYVYDDGIIKGYLMIGPCEDKDEISSFEVWGLYIDPFMQRQGIGEALMNFCEEKARQRGYSKICLWTLEKNAVGRAFYESRGYAADGSRKFLEDIGAYQVRYSKEMA